MLHCKIITKAEAWRASVVPGGVAVDRHPPPGQLSTHVDGLSQQLPQHLGTDQLQLHGGLGGDKDGSAPPPPRQPSPAPGRGGGEGGARTLNDFGQDADLGQHPVGAVQVPAEPEPLRRKRAVRAPPRPPRGQRGSRPARPIPAPPCRRRAPPSGSASATRNSSGPALRLAEGTGGGQREGGDGESRPASGLGAAPGAEPA